jgi:MFS transporter, YNFM family, putative membrane transport protein
MDGAGSTHLLSGTREYRRTSRVLFGAGFMAFSMLYVVQGVLPDVSSGFGVSPAVSSLTLSLTTLPLAIAVLVAASWSEGQGRRLLLVGSLVGAAVLTILASASPSFGVLLALRVLTGMVLAGLPPVAMAYVAEEFHPSSLGAAMGLYISGTGLGGMTGRLAGGLISSVLSWRAALLVVGACCLVGAAMVARWLPSSRHFVVAPGGMRDRLSGMRVPLGDGVVVRLALCGFLIMGSLVSFFNYLQYRLARDPFDLSSTLVALVFLLYLFGTVSANWMGRLTDRRSRRMVLLLGLVIMLAGALASLPDLLVTALAGGALMVFGFFGAHSVASGWVSRRTPGQRAQASALYLFGYQLGSTVVGFGGGLMFGAYGWSGEVVTVGVLLALGLLVAASLPAASPKEVARAS